MSADRKHPWNRGDGPVDPDKTIAVTDETQRAELAQPQYCPECGVEAPAPRANPQTVALLRFNHRHDCSASPSYRFRRKLAIHAAAAVLYQYEAQLEADSDAGIQNAVGIAEQIWIEIERRDR